MPIIRRNNCVDATLGTSYSVWMTVWYAGWNETKNKYTKNELCTKLALFAVLYRDARSTKHPILDNISVFRIFKARVLQAHRKPLLCSMVFPHCYNLDVINLGSTDPQGTIKRFHGIRVLG